MFRLAVLGFLLLVSTLARAEGQTADQLVCELPGHPMSKVVRADLVFDRASPWPWAFGNAGILKLYTDDRGSEFYDGDYVFVEIPVVRSGEMGMTWSGHGYSISVSPAGQNGTPSFFARLSGPWFSGVRGTPTLVCTMASVNGDRPVRNTP